MTIPSGYSFHNSVSRSHRFAFGGGSRWKDAAYEAAANNPVQTKPMKKSGKVPKRINGVEKINPPTTTMANFRNVCTKPPMPVTVVLALRPMPCNTDQASRRRPDRAYLRRQMYRVARIDTTYDRLWYVAVPYLHAAP